uniref:Uncharacterized protein n=1 Tax=Arundo donax TaxID=35708 RepID=A0A0A9FJ65_ARUDO
MISLTSSSVILPSASLSTMSKKVCRRPSKLVSEIWSQNSSSSALLMLSPEMLRRRASASKSSPANSGSFIPMHFPKLERWRRPFCARSSKRFSTAGQPEPPSALLMNLSPLSACAAADLDRSMRGPAARRLTEARRRSS